MKAPTPKNTDQGLPHPGGPNEGRQEHCIKQLSRIYQEFFSSEIYFGQGRAKGGQSYE